MDGKDGHAWSRSSEDTLGVDGWWGTQGRPAAICAGRQACSALRATSVTACGRRSARPCRSVDRQIGTRVLRELSAAKGYRAIGRSVCDVLSRLRGGASRALRLLVCGHLAVQWGAPWRWDPARRVVKRSPFLSSGTTGGG